MKTAFLSWWLYDFEIYLEIDLENDLKMTLKPKSDNNIHPHLLCHPMNEWMIPHGCLLLTISTVDPGGNISKTRCTSSHIAFKSNCFCFCSVWREKMTGKSFVVERNGDSANIFIYLTSFFLESTSKLILWSWIKLYVDMRYGEGVRGVSVSQVFTPASSTIAQVWATKILLRTVPGTTNIPFFAEIDKSMFRGHLTTEIYLIYNTKFFFIIYGVFFT